MNRNEICLFSPVEHAVQLDLIGKVRGFLSAESYFNSLMDHDRNDKTYGALLNCYVRERQTDKSLSHLQKMKELGFASAPLAYNNIMCLYTNLGEHEKVLHVLAEMKKNNVSPDNFSYRICINSYGARSDIEGMEKVLNEMECQMGNAVDWNTYAVVANIYIKASLADKAIEALEKSEEKLDKKDGTGYNHLITLYASLGNKAEVLRLWDLEKIECKRQINRDFVTMLESLVKLNELEEAEKILREWESSGNFHDARIPNIIVVGYCRNGLYEKAEALLEDLTEKGKASSPNSWANIASGYLEKGKTARSFECMKAALALRVDNKGWKPNHRVVGDILCWLGDEGSAEDVEAFATSLRSAIPANREIYHALLKANVRSGRDVGGILYCMKTDKIDEDEDTKKILALGRSI
ncbi:pentatricopeptide repeat-containing protein At4g21705, mitochondrial isoform X2 [Mercurialis annua]|nr:pentatricopeptide repeat-containing protein At4g21705, mitochondrial isoform X2 [Mercurialis annua]